MKKLLVGLSVMTALGGVAHASPTPGFTPGNLFNTPGISGLDTTGGDMAGMLVTMCFVGSDCLQPLPWSDQGEVDDTPSFGVVGQGWSLLASSSGDTFSSPFVLNVGPNLALRSLTMYGLAAGVAFDTVPPQTGGSTPASNPPSKSPGSGDGRPFQFQTGFGVAGTAVDYFDRLYVDGVWYGDLYLGMTVTFGGVGFSGETRFLSDTDRTTGAITPFEPTAPPVGVPLPGTLLLAGLGLACLGASRRRVA